MITKLFRALALTSLSISMLYLGGTACSSATGGTFLLSVLIEGTGTVSIAPSGSVCDADCTESIAMGDQVELSAEAAPGFTFSGWAGGGCSGTGVCNLTVNNDLQVTATFVPQQIVFTSRAGTDGNDTGVNNIWVINLDGTGAQMLAPITAIGGDSFGPTWSPDNSNILFSSSRALDGSDGANNNGTANIWVMNADGSNPQPLTQITAASADSNQAQWSPDGNQIVYASNRALNGADQANLNNTTNIWVMNADGSNAIPLSELTVDMADNFDPQWSPDGLRIAFESSRALDPSINGLNINGTRNIWVVDSDGENAMALTDLTADNADSFDPQWAPDGLDVVFHSRRDLDPNNDAANTNLTSNIWIVGSDGNDPEPLTKNTADGADSFRPSYSPDGFFVTYDSRADLGGGDAENTNGSSNIWSFNLDNFLASPLTSYTAMNVIATNPVYSSGGNDIAYTSNGAFDGSNASNGGGTSNLFIMDSDGANPQALTQNTDDKATAGQPDFTN